MPSCKNTALYTVSVASVYPHYVTKAVKKAVPEEPRSIRSSPWLQAGSQKQLETELEKRTDFETFCKGPPSSIPREPPDQGRGLRYPGGEHTRSRYA